MSAATNPTSPLHQAASAASPRIGGDPRNIATGWQIPDEGYCDQPYVVIADDGAWLCVLTTGPGLEGDTKQHIVSTRSTDHGTTWSRLVDIEPHGPPESSWVMPVTTSFGRIYAIYVFNADNLREVQSLHGPIKRVDTLGHYAFKYTDDGGRTWSRERYFIPVRAFQIDRENLYRGAVRFFWGVGKPVTHQGAVYFGAAKVGNFGEGFMASSEGFFIKSDNLLTERDPSRIRWETLPDGDVGLRAPLGPVADEHNLTALSDGSLYCTYRTIEGYLCHAYSRDGGHTWTAPQYATYAPVFEPARQLPGSLRGASPAAPGRHDGGGSSRPSAAHAEYGVGQAVPQPIRRIKHPRAANFVRRFANGKYLLWFHNHGGRWYQYRNPGWIAGGVEREGPDGYRYLHWSEPEIVLYDDDPDARISYPDFVEAGGRYFITETQKTVARVHEIDPRLLEGVWHQHERAALTYDGLALALAEEECVADTTVVLPQLPRLDRRGGFTLDLRLELERLEGGQIVLDGRDDQARGLALETAGTHGNLTLRLTLDDGRTNTAWDCDPGLLGGHRPHHVVAIVDGGPRIISFVVNGRLCDGGLSRQYGWGRFSPRLSDVNGAGHLQLGVSLAGRVRGLRVYDRALRTSEAVSNWRAGQEASASPLR